MTRVPRKVVQVAMDNDGYVCAVADDGSLWMWPTKYNDVQKKWAKLPSLPDREEGE